MSDRVMPGAKQRSAELECLTVDACRRLDAPVREDLELLDYEIRAAFARILADVDAAGGDGSLFTRASTTVLLSIAANLQERTSQQANAPFDVSAFVCSAESAALWAKGRKLRYFVAGEA